MNGKWEQVYLFLSLPPSSIRHAADPREEMVEQVQQDSKNALRVQQVNKVNKTSAASRGVSSS